MLERPSDAEEQYFKRIELEQRRAMRERIEQATAKLDDRRRVAEATGTSDMHVAERIQALGFDGDSAAIVDLLPLVTVAWADGSVSRDERSTVLKILESRGIKPSSQPFQLMETLLEERPSDAWIEEAKAVIGELVATRPDKSDDIVALCESVAAASGGFLGIGSKVSDAERKAIADVAKLFRKG